MTTPCRRHAIRITAFLACGAVALSACGTASTAEADADDNLATLETDDSAAEATGTDSTTDQGDSTADEAALALSQCLRDEGVDIPDIGVDSSGNVDLRGAFESIDRSDESFRDGLQACREVLEGVGFGGGRGALADNTEIQDAFVEFTDCIRSEGFEDVADLTFGAPEPAPGGNGQSSDGDEPRPGQGDREGGFGDRSGILAQRLGLDPDDPAVIAALDTCVPVIEQAFSDAGVGQTGGGD